MKKIILIFMLLPLMTIAQKKKIPVKQTATTVNKDGWRDLKWGATRNDVKSKYNTDDFLENYEIAGKKLDVKFHYDTNNLLESVVLFRGHFYLDKDHLKFRFVEENEMGELQNDIENGVISKFGNPSFKSNSPQYLRVWNFPNLKIEIESRISYETKITNGNIDKSEKAADLVSTDSFILKYSKPNKSETDKF